MATASAQSCLNVMCWFTTVHNTCLKNLALTAIIHIVQGAASASMRECLPNCTDTCVPHIKETTTHDPACVSQTLSVRQASFTSHYTGGDLPDHTSLCQTCPVHVTHFVPITPSQRRFTPVSTRMHGPQSCATEMYASFC